MSETTPQLPPELLIRIVGQLRRPLPRPNGRNAPAEIRQPELVALMRTSKQFNDIAAPLLYETAVVDHLPSFSHNAGRRAAAKGIRSKTQLLSLVQRLHLEYADKSAPTYLSLLASTVPFSSVGFDPKSNLRAHLGVICEAEADGIIEGVGRLGQCGGELLPNCKAFTTGVFLGGQTDIWKPMWEWQTNTRLHQKLCAARIATTSLASPRNVVTFCQRVAHGPLAYDGLIWYRGLSGGQTEFGLPGREHRSHLDETHDYVPTVISGHSRWYWPHPAAENEALMQSIGRVVTCREQCRMSLEQRPFGEEIQGGGKVTVDIYLRKGAAGRKRLEDSIPALVEYTANESYGPAAAAASRSWNDWRVKSLEDAPPCEACGWCVDDL